MAIGRKKLNYKENDYGKCDIEQIKEIIEQNEKFKKQLRDNPFLETVYDKNLKQQQKDEYDKSIVIRNSTLDYAAAVYTKKPKYTQEELKEMLSLIEKFKREDFSNDDLQKLIEKENEKVYDIKTINPELTLNTRQDVIDLNTNCINYDRYAGKTSDALLSGIRGYDESDRSEYEKLGIDEKLTVDEKAKLMIQLKRQANDRVNIFKKRNEILQSSQEYMKIKEEIKELQATQVSSKEEEEALNDKVNMLRYKAGNMCRLAEAQATLDIMSKNKDLYENFDLEKPNIKNTLDVNEYTMDDAKNEHKKMKDQVTSTKKSAEFGDDTAYTLSYSGLVVKNEKNKENEFRDGLKVSEEEQAKNRAAQAEKEPVQKAIDENEQTR